MTSIGAFYWTRKQSAVHESSGAAAPFGLPWFIDRVELPQRGKRVTKPIVSVVDDDESMRESLPDLLGELGFEGRAFASADEFLRYDKIGESTCLILDICMPEMSGPALVEELARLGYAIPTIFMTAQSQDNLPSDVMRHGDIQCLFKPFSGPALWAALNAAIGET